MLLYTIFGFIFFYDSPIHREVSVPGQAWLQTRQLASAVRPCAESLEYCSLPYLDVFFGNEVVRALAHIYNIATF